MRVVPRKPEGTPQGRRLLNGSGIGLLELNAAGEPRQITQLMASGEDVHFSPREDEATWD